MSPCALLRATLVLFFFALIAAAVGAALGTTLFSRFGFSTLLLFALLLLVLLVVLFLRRLLRQCMTCQQAENRTKTQNNQSFAFHGVLPFVQAPPP